MGHPSGLNIICPLIYSALLTPTGSTVSQAHLDGVVPNAGHMHPRPGLHVGPSQEAVEGHITVTLWRLADGLTGSDVLHRGYTKIEHPHTHYDTGKGLRGPRKIRSLFMPQPACSPPPPPFHTCTPLSIPHLPRTCRRGRRGAPASM